jgi:hypothetical protein
LPRTGPGYGRQRGLVRATEGLRGSIPSANRSATVIRAHRGPVAESRVRNGMVASAPRVDMGPGPPATACRKCRTATSHDELPDGSACVTVCRGMQRSPQERLRPLPFSGLHVQEQWVCAHVETRPALTQVVSKKAKAALSIAQQRFPRLSRAGRWRNGEDVAKLSTFLRLRFAEKCADRALREVPHCGDC